MKFIETPVKDVFLVDQTKVGDERGFFARAFCQKLFEQQGLEPSFVQVNNSMSAEVGTLRGMHFQLPPFEETKLVRCIAGALWDVVLDIRKDSPTFGSSFGAELNAENRLMMYVPKGCAHGFFTLKPDTEVIYFVSQFYSKEAERGIRWNDPAFNIAWPGIPTVVSARDQSHPDFDGAAEGVCR